MDHAGTPGESLARPLASTDPAADLDSLLRELARAPARAPGMTSGSTLGRFTILEPLGRGAFGVVYEARDTELGRHVAVKLMRTRGEPQQDASLALGALLKREAEAAARLNHPNIVTLHDHGTVDGAPFLVLELLRGETLETRIARGPLTLDEAIPIMIQLAEGLRYAHEMSVVHRDLKPGNLFLTGEGKVKILDFGLARIQAVVGSDGEDNTSRPDQTWNHLAGTPAYMAPEQWNGEAPDQRTDIYAAGLILYEMLAGQRPWPAAEPRLAALSAQPAPLLKGIPSPLAEIVALALIKSRKERLSSAAELLDRLLMVKRSLERATEMRRARRTRRALIAAAPLLVGVGWAGVKLADRLERMSTVDAHVADSDRVIRAARSSESRLESLRTRAFSAFDAADLDLAKAEEIWGQALAEGAELDRNWARAGHILERALLLDIERDDLRRRMGQVLLARAIQAERNHDLDQRDELLGRLAIHGDAGARAYWTAPAHVSIETDPPATVRVLSGVQRYPRGVELTAPIHDLTLPPGSYLLLVSAHGRPEVRYPLLLERGEDLHVSIAIPSVVPPGFVYVPSGRFLYGCPDETFRDKFGAQPEHEVTTAAFLIARHEVTFADWIAFLEALPADERALRTPHIDAEARATAAANSGANDLELLQLTNGEWQLTLRGQRVRQSEPYVYEVRTRRSRQQWLRFPVTGVSFEDGEAYASWLDRTGQVPGARMCTEHEWERAARGADGRAYPHGDRLAPDDANIDMTYGRRSPAFGPDEVGSHPASDSPFGVSDLVGNLWEWTRSSGQERHVRVRGGSWFQDSHTGRAYNREFVEPTYHSVLFGLRICADVAGS